jgi:hypothetical protein
MKRSLSFYLAGWQFLAGYASRLSIAYFASQSDGRRHVRKAGGSGWFEKDSESLMLAWVLGGIRF